MSAILTMYTDPSCLNELSISGVHYDMYVGPTTGLDGDTGDRADSIIYIKNTGNKPAIDVKLIKDNDTNGLLAFRVSTGTFDVAPLSIGDIMINQVVPVYLRVSVPRGTLASLINPNFTLKYKSLP